MCYGQEHVFAFSHTPCNKSQGKVISFLNLHRRAGVPFARSSSVVCLRRSLCPTTQHGKNESRQTNRMQYWTPQPVASCPRAVAATISKSPQTLYKSTGYLSLNAQRTRSITSFPWVQPTGRKPARDWNLRRTVAIWLFAGGSGLKGWHRVQPQLLARRVSGRARLQLLLCWIGCTFGFRIEHAHLTSLWNSASQTTFWVSEMPLEPPTIGKFDRSLSTRPVIQIATRDLRGARAGGKSRHENRQSKIYIYICHQRQLISLHYKHNFNQFFETFDFKRHDSFLFSRTHSFYMYRQFDLSRWAVYWPADTPLGLARPLIERVSTCCLYFLLGKRKIIDFFHEIVN